MSEIKIGVDWSQGDDKTCVVFIRSDGDGTFTVIGELFGEVAEFVAALETANAELLEALENIRDTARTGLPISSMTQEQYDVHRLIAIAGRADYAIRKHKGE